MTFDLNKILDDYKLAQPRRASGGLYALAGFNYQLRLYVAELAEGLAAGGDLNTAGQVFIEALSDLACRDNDKFVCIQAKRTLTRATLKDAVTEFVAIESFLKQHYPDERNQFQYALVASQGDASLSWDDLPANSTERNTAIALLAQKRLAQPRIEPDPGWRAIVAVWNHQNDPYGFVRFALDRALGRIVSTEDAQRVRDEICERYAQGRRTFTATGQLLRPQDFDAEAKLSSHLDIGKEITLARMRDRQYMPRENRRDALYAVLEERFDLRRRDLQSAARVFWLSGRSGVGKSVLLLQVVERLVREGRRVLWLGGAAEKLEPALRALAEQPEELHPEFIAIDDLYDRDARTRLDLASLGAFIDECGPYHWPLILSCGPSEFAEEFEQNSRYRGFELHRESIHPVAGDESQRLTEWYEERTGRKPAMDITTAPAFRQAQDEDGGLFVSLALELEHGELKEFAQRFAERIEEAELAQALRLPLALNRLYLRAPFEWLTDADREKLAVLNREGDFSLLDSGEAGKVVRLTHPHLGDVLYRALRKPSNATAYAHDLRDVFRRAVQEGRVPLLVQLLRLFSAGNNGLAKERLAKVDGVLLAEECAGIWKDTGGSIVMNDEEVADIASSWACWSVTQPNIVSILGDDLAARAIASLAIAVKVWPFCWRRLWESGVARSDLQNWALAHLPELVRRNHPAWSFVWETVQQGDAERARWQGMGLAWLESHTHRPDWHYVWKHLVPDKVSGNWNDYPALVLGEKRLMVGGDGPDWAYVLEDMLTLAEDFPVVQQRLLEQGWQWLAGREDRAEWAHVWRHLLVHREHLPLSFTLELLLERGWQWLQGREDRAEWMYVWRALLEYRNQLPQGVTLDGMLASGWQWLQGREDRIEWTRVWQALLAQREHLPQGVTLEFLLERGWQWLAGREDRFEWNYMWRALLEHRDHLPQGVTLDRLLASGWQWLQGREDRFEWSYVWQALLAQRDHLPQGVTLDGMLASGWQWLQGREDRAEWAHVWRALLEHRDHLPQGVTLDRLLATGWQWLQGREDRAEWMYVWRALLEYRNQLPQGVTLDGMLASGWQWLQGREDRAEWTHVWQALYSQPASANRSCSKYQFIEMAWSWLELHRDAKDWPVIWWDVVHDTSEAVERRQALMKMGVEWLGDKDNLATPEASRFVEGLLDMGCRDASFLTLATRWLSSAREEKPWAIIAAKYIEAAPFAPAASEMAKVIAARIRARPNYSVIHKSATIMERLGQLTNLPPEIADMVQAFSMINTAPAWERARACKRNDTTIHGKVVYIKRDFCSVELDIGLMGLVLFDGFEVAIGEVLNLVVQQVEPEKRRVVLRLADDSSGEVVVGDVHDGIVNNESHIGLFVNVHSRTGLIHKSRMSEPKMYCANHPKGTPIRVRVLSILPKGLELEPADTASQVFEIVVGGEYEGKVTGLEAYGIFVRIGKLSGLIPRNLLPLDYRERHPLGSSIRVRVLEKTPKGLKLGLSKRGDSK